MALPVQGEVVCCITTGTPFQHSSGGRSMRCAYACLSARTSAGAQPGSTVMRIPDIVRRGMLGVLYVVTAQMGLTLDTVQGFAAAVWPPPVLPVRPLGL